MFDAPRSFPDPLAERNLTIALVELISPYGVSRTILASFLLSAFNSRVTPSIAATILQAEEPFDYGLASQSFIVFLFIF